MTRRPRSSGERYRRSAASFIEDFSGSKLKEYSLMIYIGFFLILNLGNITMLSPTGWTVYEPYNPSPSNESVLNDNSPQISAAYWDEDGDSGTLRFYESSGTSIGSCSVSNGSRCGVEWTGASAHDNYWYSVAEDNNGDTAEGPSWYFLVNNPPNTVSSPDNPADGSTIYGDSVNLKATVTDPDGDDMNVEFLNNVTNASEDQRTAYGVADGGQASVSLDLTRGRTYKWWVKVHDSWDTTKSGSWTFYVNSLPNMESVQPLDGAVHTDTEVILNGTATDNEENQVTMYFYDSEDNFLGKDSGNTGEKLSSDKWTGLELGNTYSWKVNVSDGHGNATYQPFSFITSASEEYRVDHTVGVKYSRIITSQDSSEVFLLEIENQVSTEKKMRTYLEGPNAFFNKNGQSSIDYTLKGYETKEFTVTVQPNTPDRETTLDIISENKRIGINTTESIPVTVRKVPQVAETRDIPGITGIQLIAIMLLSVLLYYPRL